MSSQRYRKKRHVQAFLKRIGCTLQKNSTRIESVTARRILSKIAFERVIEFCDQWCLCSNPKELYCDCKSTKRSSLYHFLSGCREDEYEVKSEVRCIDKKQRRKNYSLRMMGSLVLCPIHTSPFDTCTGGSWTFLQVHFNRDMYCIHTRIE